MNKSKKSQNIFLTNHLLLVFFITISISCNKSSKQENQLSTQDIIQSIDYIKTENVTFESEGVKFAGTIYSLKIPYSTIVIVHGSDRVPRMTEFAEQLA